MDDEEIQEELRRALAGDEAAQTRLVRALTPVIQRRVARFLLPRRKGRDIRQEVENFIQEVFLILIDDDWKVLRSWEPERGLSLQNFVGLVAKRVTASILRSGKRSPWKEDPTLIEDLDRTSPEPGPEEFTASRELLLLLLDRLTEELSPQGWHLFELLFLRELPIEEVMRQTNMTADAVYQWRSRLRRVACRLLEEMSEGYGEKRRARRRRKP